MRNIDPAILISIVIALLIAVPMSCYYIVNFPLDSGMIVLDVEVMYQGDFQERANLSSDKMFEDACICILFYNLDINQSYIINLKGGQFIMLFAGEEEALLFFRVSRGNWCYLEKNDDDIVWVLVGK